MPTIKSPSGRTGKACVKCGRASSTSYCPDHMPKGWDPSKPFDGGTAIKTPEPLRQAVLERDGFRCRYCDKAAAQVDHVTPRSAGGADTLENLVASCGKCNLRKGNR